MLFGCFTDLLSAKRSRSDFMAFGHMAVAAVCLEEVVANVYRVHKILHLGPRRDVFLFLADNRMAEIAILGYGPAVPTLVLAVMAAEAAGEIEVSDIIRVCVPVDLHLGEEVP